MFEAIFADSNPRDWIERFVVDRTAGEPLMRRASSTRTMWYQNHVAS
jgi:hypothetical protein